MKIVDYISKHIQEYPSLYKSNTYEDSKLKVLDHTFFVIGNGIDFAISENGKEEGYLIDNYDVDIIKPYGEETFRPIPDSYFEDKVYYLYNFDKPKEIIKRKDRFDTNKYNRFDKSVTPYLMEAFTEKEFRPYPICEYSKAHEVCFGNKFLQPDWLIEMKLLCERTLVYFNTEEEYKQNIYYPTEKKILFDYKSFKTTMEDGGIKAIKDLRKLWGYKISDSIPDIEEIIERKNKAFVDFRKKQLKLLEKMVKYNP